MDSYRGLVVIYLFTFQHALLENHLLQRTSTCTARQDIQSLRRALGLGGVAEKNWQPPRRAAEVGLWQQLIVLVGWCRVFVLNIYMALVFTITNVWLFKFDQFAQFAQCEFCVNPSNYFWNWRRCWGISFAWGGMLRQQQDPNVAMGRYTYGRLHLLLRGRTSWTRGKTLLPGMPRLMTVRLGESFRTPWKKHEWHEYHEFILQFFKGPLEGDSLKSCIFSLTGSPRYEMDAVAPHASVAPLVHKHFEIQAWKNSTKNPSVG